MTPSLLLDVHTPLVFDASVGINLLACGRIGDVLRLLGRPVVMADKTFDEIKSDPATKTAAAPILGALIDRSLLQKGPISGTAHATFMALLEGRTDTSLDDGEAAAIAHVLDRGGTLVLNDRTALGVVARQFPFLQPLNSIDILSAPAVLDGLGRDACADLVYRALYHARMRVRDSAKTWVADLIGLERAVTCPSLGRRFLARLQSGAAS